MPAVDFICLANSFKLGWRCVAGLRADGGGWLRPVSEREHGELQFRQYELPDHSEPRMLDLIRAGLEQEQTPLPQPENRVIDGSRWHLVSRPAPRELEPVVCRAVAGRPELLGDCESSVPWSRFLTREDRASLALVRTEAITWRTGYSSAQQQKRHASAFVEWCRLHTAGHRADLRVAA
jgi:hypothetical protein